MLVFFLLLIPIKKNPTPTHTHLYAIFFATAKTILTRRISLRWEFTHGLLWNKALGYLWACKQGFHLDAQYRDKIFLFAKTLKHWPDGCCCSMEWLSSMWRQISWVFDLSTHDIWLTQLKKIPPSAGLSPCKWDGKEENPFQLSNLNSLTYQGIILLKTYSKEVKRLECGSL